MFPRPMLVYLTYRPLGSRMVQGSWSDKGEVAAGFLKTFEMLRIELDREVNVNTQISLFKVIDQTEDIGK